jgi:hypothetical protein
MKITAIKINKDELQLLDDTDLPNGIPIRLCYNTLYQFNITGTKQGNLLKDIHKNSNGDELKQWKNIPTGKVFNLYYSLQWKNIVLNFFIKSLGFFSFIYLLSFFITIDLKKPPDPNPPNTPPFNITIKENTEKEFETKGWIALAILLLTNMDWLGLNKVSFGLLANGFNFEILKEKLDEVGEGQEKNEKNIDRLIGFLLKNSLNKEEWKILYNLYHNCPHKFEPTVDLLASNTSLEIPENQFRRLRTLGLIVRKDGIKLEFPCKEMEYQDINQFITVTPEAIMNIKFIEQQVVK